MPALEALQGRLRAAHTQCVGISIDTTFCHAAWAEQLGGISFPLLSDFHPKGEISHSLGAYIDAKGITGRATVLIDAKGVVRFAEMATSKRDIDELVAKCEALDAGWGAALPDSVAPRGLPEDAALYIKDNCMFSRWALYARHNLHLEDALPLHNVSRDEQAGATLEKLGGKTQAPALICGGEVMYESAAIAQYLAERASWK